MSTTNSTSRTSDCGPRGGRSSSGKTPSPASAERRVPFVSGRRSGLRTRPRSRGLIAGAAVLVLLFGLATAWAVSTAGEKVSVLSIGTPVAKGQVIEREALVSSTVAGVPGAIPVDQAPEVIGKTAAVDLVQGQLLTEAMVTDQPTPAEGRAVVGLALEPTKVPAAGLEPGDLVQVIRVAGPEDIVPNTNSNTDSNTGSDVGTVLSAAATVYEVGGDVGGGSEVLLTLVLPQADAAGVAAASTAGQAAVIEISSATANPSAEPSPGPSESAGGE